MASRRKVRSSALFQAGNEETADAYADADKKLNDAQDRADRTGASAEYLRRLRGVGGHHHGGPCRICGHRMTQVCRQKKKFTLIKDAIA